MDQLKHLLLFCLVPLFLYGCQSNQHLISRLWFYTYSEGAASPGDTLITPASFLDLRGNGRYTMDFNGFDAGKWRVTQNGLVLTSDKNKEMILPVKYVSEKNLQIYTHQAYY